MTDRVAAVQRMQDYILAHLPEEIPLSDLAEAAHFSRGTKQGVHFSHLEGAPPLDSLAPPWEFFAPPGRLGVLIEYDKSTLHRVLAQCRVAITIVVVMMTFIPFYGMHE